MGVQDVMTHMVEPVEELVFATQHRPVRGLVIDGVFVPVNLLEALADQKPWDSHFGGALLIDNRDQERVLLDRGLAVMETRGGYHGTQATRELFTRVLDAWSNAVVREPSAIELLREARDVVRLARCSTEREGTRREWGRRRRKLMDDLAARLHDEELGGRG